MQPKDHDGRRPNVLIILADDLGFSDVGAFGGEIQTPNIDKLAREGLRMTDFHTASACSPTRAMLLSGTDHHVSGIGSMAERMTAEIEGKPGYEGYLNDRIVSIQELMRDSGYETMISGKWHLGMIQDRMPSSRGFNRSFGLMNGCHNHYGWEPQFQEGRENVPRLAANMRRMYFDHGKWVDPADLPENFYSTDSFTDTLIEYLEDRASKAGSDNEPQAEKKPFFAYLPFSAPHWPLQAPLDMIAKYKGMYDDGPDALRQRRLKKLKELGLVPEGAVAAPVISKDEDGNDTKSFEDMTQTERKTSSRKMEAYAGMVDRIDWNVGRLRAFLEESGEWDNTIVMFSSDNGAEGAQFGAWPLTAGGDIEAHIAKYYDNSIQNIGAYNSFAWYGSRWASASTAPGLLFKMFTSEGGIRLLHGGYPAVSGSFDGNAPKDAGAYFAILMIYVYAAAYSFSWNAMPWIFAAEVFPTKIRGLAMLLTVLNQWLSQFVIIYATPYMIDDISFGVFFFFGACILVSSIVVYLFIPETKRFPMEKMHLIFEGSIWAPGARKEADRRLAEEREEEEAERNVLHTTEAMKRGSHVEDA